MCDYCRQNQPLNIISINAPGFWVKIQIENKKMLFAYDEGNNGMRQRVPIKFCPFCGEEVNK